MDEQIAQAVRVFKQGGIVIFPTDTAFGIGCRMDDEQAVRRLFRIRKRPETQAVPVLIDSLEMIKEYIEPISNEVKQKLIAHYWPGALTIILPCHPEKVPVLVRGGTKTLGIRMPNHPVALELINAVGVPLLGPSANFHGDPTPYSFFEVNEELQEQVDYVLPGECFSKQPSTVIDCSIIPWEILRKGAVKVDF
ncbi:MAG TPA: L-threonylcarbamoyladenylate synthase [Methylomirabilota bacterium]|nr:L-threonylcarbamoyladenylate synthase [Methylomirabilota bacterium]